MKIVAKFENVGGIAERVIVRTNNDHAARLIAEGWHYVPKAVYKRSIREDARLNLQEFHTTRRRAKERGMPWPEIKRRFPLPVA